MPTNHARRPPPVRTLDDALAHPPRLRPDDVRAAVECAVADAMPAIRASLHKRLLALLLTTPDA